jgi:hypothetical protein
VRAYPQLEFKSARQRATEKPPVIDWQIENLAAVGVVTEIDGPLKTAGKTTFIAHAVSKKLGGQNFLGGRTKAGPVVWLTEEGWASFQEPIREAGLLDRDDLYILCREDAIGVPWAEVARQARELTLSVGAKLLIGDTLSSLAGLRGEDENSAGAAMEAIRPIQEIAAAGVAVLVTRHERRAGGEVGESGRGSTAFSGAVDMIFRLTRLGGQGRDTMRQLDYIGRIRNVPATRIIELIEDGYILVGSASDVKLLAAKQVLLEWLPDSEEDAITLPALLAQAKPEKVSRDTFYRAIEALHEDGKAHRKQISARKYLWWRVSDAPVPIRHIRNESESEAVAGSMSDGLSPYRDRHIRHPATDARPSDVCPVCQTPCLETGDGLVCPVCAEAAEK